MGRIMSSRMVLLVRRIIKVPKFTKGVKKKEIANQKPQSEAGRNPRIRELDYNVEPNEVKELDTRLKSQNKKWAPLSFGKSTLENKISGSIDNEAKRTNGLNIFK